MASMSSNERRRRKESEKAANLLQKLYETKICRAEVQTALELAVSLLRARMHDADDT